MRTNIPSFRLPESVLDDEIDMILDMGVDIRYNSPVSSMKALLDRGLRRGLRRHRRAARQGPRHPRPLRAPTNIHIGIDWLESVAFGHIDTIGEKVLIIGVGNTAMDCCRTSRRLGGKDIKVMARRPRRYFKASPWELEDAEEEQVEIVINHAPKRFVVENGKLKGMEFEQLEWNEDAKGKQIVDRRRHRVHPGRRRDPRHRPGERLPLDRARHRHRVRQVGHARRSTRRRSSRRAPGVFFGGDAAWGPKNIIWAVAHGHEAAISIHNHCQGVPLTERPAAGHEPDQPEDGASRVELQQRLQPGQARRR